MEKIIVGFSRPKKWKPFAWLIMTAFGTPYDHVYVKWYSQSSDRYVIYQASKTMINFMGSIVFNSENLIIAEFEVNLLPDDKKMFMQFAIDNAGKPYSMKEALGLGLVRICELFGKKIKNPFNEGDGEYVCSVLAACVLQKYTNIQIGDFAEADPKDIYDLLDSLSKAINSGVVRCVLP